jgi:hypothetical protein
VAVIDLAYLLFCAREKLQALRAWVFWRLVPQDVTSIQLYRCGPALMTGDELRLSTAPTTLYRPGSLA